MRPYVIPQWLYVVATLNHIMYLSISPYSQIKLKNNLFSFMSSTHHWNVFHNWNTEQRLCVEIILLVNLLSSSNPNYQYKLVLLVFILSTQHMSQTHSWRTWKCHLQTHSWTATNFSNLYQLHLEIFNCWFLNCTSLEILSPWISRADSKSIFEKFNSMHRRM